MRKYLYTLILLLALLPALLHADELSLVVADACLIGEAGGGGAAGGDPCSDAGCPATHMLCWTGDYTDHTGYACITNGGVTEDATNVDMTISTDYGDSSYGTRRVTPNDYLRWTNTDQRIVTCQGAMTVWMRIRANDDAATADHQIMEITNTGDG